MSVPIIAFFSNKGGVGKTTLVQHLSWMYADLGLRVVTADLDPQCNLTSAFLDEDRLEEIFQGDGQHETIFGSLQPLIRGIGDVIPPKLEPITSRLALIVGDMELSTFEDQLSEVWPKCLDRDERAFRVTSSLWRVLQAGAESQQANVILVDLGPNLGAINRAALIASDFVVIPLGPDLFSLQGLRNLGPALCRWRDQWGERVAKNVVEDLALPEGAIKPVGYILMRHSIRLDRPVKAFDRWMAKMPQVYVDSVLNQPGTSAPALETDSNCIDKLKDYRSLMPLAQEARKPMFYLKPADGALGAHAKAAQLSYSDFKQVALSIAMRTGIIIP